MNIEKVLKSFGTVQNFLMSATEIETKQLLDAELSGKKRLSLINRIYGRYVKLRDRRERIEMIDKVLK